MIVFNLNIPEELQEVARGYGIVQVWETAPLTALETSFEHQVSLDLLPCLDKSFQSAFYPFKEDAKKKKRKNVTIAQYK